MASSEANKSYYQTLKHLHRCVRCRTQDARTLTGKSVCFDCLEKKRNEMKGSNNSQYIKDLRKKCESEGICVTCHKKKADIGYKQCTSCKEKARKSYYDNLAKEGRIPRSEAKSYGVCSICLTAPRYKDNNTCIDCYNTVVNKFKGTNVKTRWNTIIKADVVKKEWYSVQKEATGI